LWFKWVYLAKKDKKTSNGVAGSHDQGGQRRRNSLVAAVDIFWLNPKHSSAHAVKRLLHP
jgi:hypothetical protein